MILMYHAITQGSASIPPDREVGADLYDVSVDNFYQQMKALKKSGKDVIITFDDGEMNNYTYALSILKEFGLKAYFFIIVKRIGKPGYMGYKELAELLAAGMKIGSHGLTHEILTNLKDSQIEEELRASKQSLEINLNTTIDAISIPRGFCDDNVIQKAYALGYKEVFISQRPKQLKSTCLERTAVKGSWSIQRFNLALENKRPIDEVIKDCLKRFAKFILRESGYNAMRSLIINMVK